MKEKVLGALVLVVTAAAATWAVCADRNVIREAREDHRLVDRGAKAEVKDPVMERGEEEITPNWVPPDVTGPLPWFCYDSAKDCGDVADRYCSGQIPPQKVAFQSYDPTAELQCRFTCTGQTGPGGAAAGGTCTENKNPPKPKPKPGPGDTLQPGDGKPLGATWAPTRFPLTVRRELCWICAWAWCSCDEPTRSTD